jgi:signal peptidase
MDSPGDERDSDGEHERSGPAADVDRDDPEEPTDDRLTRTDPATPRPGDADRPEETPPAREEWRDDGEDGEWPSGEEPRRETDGWRIFVYDVLSSVLAVMVVGAYLFAISGVWPPLVAVESESMTPNMQVNDLVFVMEADRFPGPEARGESGVVTARAGQTADYRKFGGHGDVIVYERDGNGQRVPIIHRAMLWVDGGENWYDRADPDHVGGAAECGDSPEEGMRNCPAPHAGFITKGDSNGRYDQVSGLSGPVRPEWVVGTAEVRIPGLGWIRLQSGAAAENATATPRSSSRSHSPVVLP